MGLEIEAKFRVDDDVTFSSLLHRATCGPFQFVPIAGVEQQHNTYFDTSDGRISAAGYSLRIRVIGERRIATLKRTRSRQGNVRVRDEWELPIGRSDHPHVWPAGEFRDRVLGVLGNALLEPLFVVETCRQHIHVCEAERAFAVLCLDRGIVRAGELTERFRELEVEMLELGAAQSFHSLVRLLHTTYPLFPEHRTKKARGLALRQRLLAEALVC